MAGLSCGAKMLKFIMFFLNFVFWVVGGTLLGIGIWFAVDDNISFLEDLFGDSSPMDDGLWAAAVYTIIGVGAFVFLLGFLGCCGACTQNTCMLCLYEILVSIVLLAEVVCVILMLVFWTDIDEGFDDAMMETVITKYGQDDNGASTKSQDKMHQDFECCGAKGPEDWQLSAWYNDSTKAFKVPASCCDMPQKGDEDYDEDEYKDCSSEVGEDDPKLLFTDGCIKEMKDWIDENAIIFIAVVCSFIGLEILGLIFACCLKSSFEKQDGVV